MQALEEIWYESKGARLFAVANGSGDPIILLHGGLGNHLACRMFAAPLASRFRLITPDLRASGRSVDAGPLSWDQLANDVAALMRHLGLRHAIVGGVSFGAACAVRFALRHPALLRALVLVTPAHGGTELGLTADQQAALHAMDAAGRRAIDEGVGVLHPLFATLPEATRARALAVVDGFDPASVAATTQFLASGGQPFASAADLAAIIAPTLLVPGSDPFHPPVVSDVYARGLPRCTVRTGDIADAIGDFIARL